jgi:hypothetical protein
VAEQTDDVESGNGLGSAWQRLKRRADGKGDAGDRHQIDALACRESCGPDDDRHQHEVDRIHHAVLEAEQREARGRRPFVHGIEQARRPHTRLGGGCERHCTNGLMEQGKKHDARGPPVHARRLCLSPAPIAVKSPLSYTSVCSMRLAFDNASSGHRSELVRGMAVNAMRGMPLLRV